ncbi:putative membrane protein [Vibrio vulnificus]|nr:putative membrane protein [Vibrio vulnificus]
MSSQNLLVFKSYERPQSLSQFGFQNSSGLLVSQIGLILGLVNLKVLKFKLTNCLRGIRNAWHFKHAVSFVIKLVCGSFCSALLTP